MSPEMTIVETCEPIEKPLSEGDPMRSWAEYVPGPRTTTITYPSGDTDHLPRWLNSDEVAWAKFLMHRVVTLTTKGHL